MRARKALEGDSDVEVDATVSRAPPKRSRTAMEVTEWRANGTIRKGRARRMEKEFLGYKPLSQHTGERILKIQASLTAHWHDKGADWRGLGRIFRSRANPPGPYSKVLLREVSLVIS